MLKQIHSLTLTLMVGSLVRPIDIPPARPLSGSQSTLYRSIFVIKSKADFVHLCNVFKNNTEIYIKHLEYGIYFNVNCIINSSRLCLELFLYLHCRNVRQETKLVKNHIYTTLDSMNIM